MSRKLDLSMFQGDDEEEEMLPRSVSRSTRHSHSDASADLVESARIERPEKQDILTWRHEEVEEGSRARGGGEEAARGRRVRS